MIEIYMYKLMYHQKVLPIIIQEVTTVQIKEFLRIIQEIRRTKSHYIMIL